MTYRITTGPTSEPITLSFIRNFLKLDDITADDDLLLALLASARLWVENLTGRCLMQQTVTQYLSAFPCGRVLELVRTPAASVTSLQYKASPSASYTTWADTNYTLDEVFEPSRIVLNYGLAWPTITPDLDVVKITYVAGYTSASDIPAPIKQAMCLLIGYWYDNREDMQVSETNNPAVRSAMWLLDQYKLQTREYLH